ncbi:DUF4145 domain-containing protein [Planotetraspora sp. GP83]|uniref:DUF4145 domain-containing protein n=1 Tax=Planotetraspora sp. GP83 TaxID=3156264 RepID=UPI003518E154
MSFTRARAQRLTPQCQTNISMDGQAATFERIWVCSHCGQGTVEVLVFGEGEIDRAPLEVLLLWPTPEARELDLVVPEPIRDRFAEGARCESVRAYRGAAAMYRAAVEELCKDRGATKYKLYEKIEELRTSIGDELVAFLHEARMLGNDSVHDGLVFSAEEVADVAELIIELTDVLYVQPARRAAMRQSRQQRRDAAKTATL